MQPDEERTEREEADEKQQQKVTFQSCAVRVFQFCACISRSFLCDRPRWDFDICMSPGAHRTRGSGDARQSTRGQKKGGGGKASKASG